MIAFRRVIDAFRAEGLHVKDNGHGKARAQAPGHSGADLSVSITDIGDQVLIWSHSDPTDQVLAALGLTMADLFDSPQGIEYHYPDHRIVRRSPDKKFSQGGNTKGTALYRADRILGADTVYLVEGEKDVHALEALGAIATCTAMGAGKAHLFDLTPLHGKNVIIVRDMDAPGAAHVRQLTELLAGQATVTVVHPAAGKDAADHIAAGHGIDEFTPAPDIDDSIRLTAALDRIAAAAQTMTPRETIAYAYAQLDALTELDTDDTPAKFSDLVDDWWDWIDAPTEARRIISTPWPELDDAISGGLHPGRSYLTAARPGSGKSLILSNIAAHAAMHGYTGILFSVEMGRMEVISRILAAGAHAEYGQITGRRLDEYNRTRIASYASDAHEMTLWICDRPTVTVEHIRARVGTFKRTIGLDFIAVDYIQLLCATDPRLPREQQIAAISRGLKTMAEEFDIAVISACQLNRSPAKDNRPPTISELRESGSLEQDADVVILLQHKIQNGQLSGEIDLIIGKNRTGPLTTITQPWRAYQARIG